MTPLTPTADTVELTEIVDAIADCDVATDSVKAGLLQRIQTEQGIVSAGLREDIIAMFRKQAEAESAAIKEDGDLLGKQQKPSAPTPEDAAAEEAVLSEALQAEQQVSKEVQTLVDSVRADVNRMDRAAAQGAENIRLASDQQTIEQIRQNLASGSSTSAA